MKRGPAAEQRKAGGVHYTPPELADFLAEATVQHAPLSKQSIVVLDPACGDGVLLQAFAERLPLSLRRRVILIGFETDSSAIASARSRLGALEVSQVQLSAGDFLSFYESESAEGYPRTLFEKQSDIRCPRADVVIANPPYVRTQVLGAMKSQDLACRFGLSGRVDLYHAFVKAIVNVLEPSGTMGLLTSNRFFFINSGGSLRKLLREGVRLRAVYDLGDTKLFSAAVLPAIVIAQKETPVENSTVPFTRIYEFRRGKNSSPEVSWRGSALEALRDGRAGLVETENGTFEVRRGALEVPEAPEGPWSLSTPETDAWLSLVENARVGSFGDVAEIRVGIKTTADAVFIRSDWDQLPSSIRPEPALLKPLIVHQDAARWQLNRDLSKTTEVLYPHTIRDGKRFPVDLGEFPKAKAYLESHRDRLASRKYVLEAGRRWYEIWVPQNPGSWQLPKVVFPDIAETPRFFLDESGAIVNGDCYWIVLRRGADPRWLRMILAVANSTLATDYYDAKFNNKLYSGRRRFITQYVRTFPLPSLESIASRKLLACVDKMIEQEMTAKGREKLEPQLERQVRVAFGLREEVPR